jgi:hypothetical protein
VNEEDIRTDLNQLLPLIYKKDSRSLVPAFPPFFSPFLHKYMIIDIVHIPSYHSHH